MAESQGLIATSNGGFHEHCGLHFMNTQSWRWRESNPRPSASHRAFSERSRRLDLGALAVAGEFEGPQPTFSVPGGQSLPACRAETGRTGYVLSSQRELRLGICFLFRLFNVVPETTARFSRIDDQSRNRSPPYVVKSPWYRRKRGIGTRKFLSRIPCGPPDRRSCPPRSELRARHHARRRGWRWRGACRRGAALWPGPAPPWPGRL